VSDRPKAPLTTTTSIWPAAAVLGIAVVMLVIFMVINLVADQGVATTTTTVPTVVGGLQSEPSGTLLSNCKQPGNPPSNIDDAFLLPVTTRANGPFNLPNAGAGDFDCLRSFITQASPAELLGYYSTQLEARGWALFSTGSSKGSPQDLFQKAGADTFYWVVGITVNSTKSGSTNWTFRIYQVSETI
jgi:hypothetical protein